MQCLERGQHLKKLMWAQVTTKAMDEEMHIPRPPWLGMAVHVLNFVVACVDFLLAHPRSFSFRAEVLSVVLSLLYVHWILLCSYFNKTFPYPFLNNLPWPHVSFSPSDIALRTG